MVVSAFYLSFLPTDGLQNIGGKYLKFGFWAILLFSSGVTSISLFCSSTFDSSQFRKFKWMLIFLAAYVSIHMLIQPPEYNWVQFLSLCFLIPLMSVLGFIASRFKRDALWALAILAGSYVLVAFLVAVFSGLYPGYQSIGIRIFPSWIVPNTAQLYQNTTLMVGIFSLMSWFWFPRIIKSKVAVFLYMALGAFAILLVPELGGRAGLLALVFGVLGCVAAELYWQYFSDVGKKIRAQYFAGACVRGLLFFLILALPFTFNSSFLVHRFSDFPAVISRMQMHSEALNYEALNYEALNSEALNSEALHSEALHSEALNSEASNSEASNSEASNSKALNSELKSTSYRIDLYSSALRQWTLDYKSILIGNGSQSYPKGLGENTPKWHPHNFILEMLAEFGLLGALFFIAPLVVLGLMMLRCLLVGRPKCDADQIVAIAVAGMFMCWFLFTGGIESIWLLFFVMFLACPALDVKQSAVK